MNVDSSQSITLPSFVTAYPTSMSAYDEMCTTVGTVRPHWDYVIRALETLGAQELARRGAETQRLLREDGVTYNVYDDSQGMTRSWELDLVPLLLTSQEWSTIERGLIQRAELLNLILADLYGPRTLIARGLLPPEVVYAHPGFLLPCTGVRPANNCYLPLYATDLARAPDGSVWVIGDRTQAPSGSGYALENRVVLSRVLPSLYRDSHVHRVALFFRALRTTLSAFAPQRRDNPRIVLLTPGPENETYFEHAYLANYLGFTLVQGGDLTVRDGRVWLSTVDGLQPVDVILRRVDDTFCDPLELRQDSLLGVPGLLQAARLGRVAVVNPLGSGVLENPALMAFLPGLARQLLGQELRLPSVATWWCGAEKERAYVLAHLDRMVIKPIFPHASTATVFGARLSLVEQQQVAEQIRAQPHLFVGQEHVALSTTPVLNAGRLAPRPMVLRSFLVARDDAYVVMPGGLTRVAASLDNWIVSNQQGGISKDTWVLASEPERDVSLLPSATHAVEVIRSRGEVPGRVADNLFWLGRYAERAEGTARLLRTVLMRLLEIDAARVDTCVAMLLRVVTHLTTTYPGFIGEGAEGRLAAPEEEVLEVIRSHQRPGSLHCTLHSLMLAARSVRDRLPDDSWRVINSLADLEQPLQVGVALTGLEQLLFRLAAFTGLTTECMSRGYGWRFLDMGRRLERALFGSGLLRAVCLSPMESENALWEALLAITDNLVTYRRRYRLFLQEAPVLDLLLLDEGAPRSVAYQLVRLQEHVTTLPKNAVVAQRGTEERLVLEALTMLRLAEMERLLLVPAGKEDREVLDQLLSRVGYLLRSLSDTLTVNYFRQTALPRQLVDIQ
jgi:uncharacterized circularly permuted ATP-grasp superfamily protein/uncharacterized alpha-E superfamily protein